MATILVEKFVFNCNIPNYYNLYNGDREYGRFIKNSLNKIASTIMSDLKHGKVGENYMKKQNYEDTKLAYNELIRFYGNSSVLSGFNSLIDKFYIDIVKEIEKLKSEAKDLDIGTYDEWTNGDAIVYWYDKKFAELTEKKVNAHKEKYIAALASAINTVAENYDIPPVMLAGVAYIEFGGDPPIFDIGGFLLRENVISENILKFFPIYRPSNQTSFGNISMQLRRAAETLKFYRQLDSILEVRMIKLLNDDKTALILVARHLIDLKNKDFPEKRGSELTDEEMATVVGRYNVGPDVSYDTAKNCSYAQRFYSMIGTLKSWIE